MTDDTFDTVHNLFEQQISNEKLIGSDNLMWKFIYLYPGKFDVLYEHRWQLLPIFRHWCSLVRPPTRTFKALSQECIDELSLQCGQLMFEHKISEYNETLLKLIYKCVRLVYSHITTIEDLPTQCDFYNELLFVCKGHNIPLNFKQFPTYFGDVHKLITVALCGLDEYTYKSNFKFDINTVKFMLFADGRNRETRALDTICFNKERTFDNTFYLDTDISAVPDSISDLTRVNKNLVYHVWIIQLSLLK